MHLKGVLMKILVTGGAGYIGSHTCVELLNQDHQVVIVDNLSNSKIETIGNIKTITGKDVTFYQYDACNFDQMNQVFKDHHIEGVIHFAGFKAVGESVEKPIMYYKNNLMSTLVVSQLCQHHGVKKMVFSSSATVYGDNPSPLNEDMVLKKTTNPYGETKVMCERILTDICLSDPDFQVSLLRYFNPVGAHESGLIGEDPNDIPNNLVPYITKVAKGALDQLYVFGDDYDTWDGTGVRDYVHVVDLAKGHIKALDHLKPGAHIYNLGTGRGYSVFDMVKTFEGVNGMKIPYQVIGRRPGDLARAFADVDKAKRDLDWQAEKTIEDMLGDSWRFEKQNN